MKSTKLNQVIAVVSGQKTRTQNAVTEIYHKCQKTDLFSGLSRKYTPLDEEGEQIPSESKLVQYKADDAIAGFTKHMSKLLNVVATQEYANTEAKADITVAGGEILLSNVPVGYLLFLDKQLQDVKTFVSKLPTLDTTDKWVEDANVDCFATEPSASNRTKKVLKNHVKAVATEHHPEQVEVYSEDTVIGHWSTVKFSGALPMCDKTKMLERVEELQQAVKFAREEANNLEVTNKTGVEAILDFVFE